MTCECLADDYFNPLRNGRGDDVYVYISTLSFKVKRDYVICWDLFTWKMGDGVGILRAVSDLNRAGWTHDSDAMLSEETIFLRSRSFEAFAVWLRIF